MKRKPVTHALTDDRNLPQNDARLRSVVGGVWDYSNRLGPEWKEYEAMQDDNYPGDPESIFDVVPGGGVEEWIG